MKLMNINDPDAFIKAVSSCKGKVEIVSKDGDVLNLKSKLTQYVSLIKLLSGDYIKEVELVVHDPEDVRTMMCYMLNGK